MLSWFFVFMKIFVFILSILKCIFQIMNVYITNYDSGGQYWPIVHKATIFALVLTQIIALGVFGIKRSSVASGFTIPLIIGTLLFNAYCGQRFSPTFNKLSAQVLIRNASLSRSHFLFCVCQV